MSYYITKTTDKAPIATFSDGADDVPTKSLVVTIPPTLSGDSSVTETQTGRNLAVFDDGTYTSGGVTFTCNNQVVTVSNTSTTTYPQVIIAQNLLFKKGTYTASITVENEPSGGHLYIILQKGGSNYVSTKNGSSTFTLTEDSQLNFLAVAEGNGITWNDATLKFQIEFGSTAHDYEPYQTPTVYTANLGRTIYGGEVDIVNGTGTDENGNDFTFDGQEIPTRLGYNAFWSEQGDTEVTYYCLVESEKLYTVTDTTLKNIADAIRTKTERTAPILVEDMDDEILSIVTGGGGSCERLFYLRCYNNDYSEIPQASSWNKSDKFDNYVSYDSSTRKFTVLQDFTGLIVAWVYTYQTYMSSRSDGAFYINGKQIGQYEAAANEQGSKGGSYFIYPFKTGDTFWPYTPTRDGYPQQNLKVYIASDQDDSVWSFTDEEAT